MKTKLQMIGLGLMAGMVGVLATLAVVHTWNDHAALHTIIQMINENAAKQGKP